MPSRRTMLREVERSIALSSLAGSLKMDWTVGRVHKCAIFLKRRIRLVT
jgi:hypothetical protein